MTYDSGRTPGADLGGTSAAVPGAVLVGLLWLLLAASWPTARGETIASSSVHFSHRAARPTPLFCKCIQVTLCLLRISYDLLSSPGDAETAARRWGIPTSFSLYNKAR